jgi:N-acetylmuramoyl-L-alanine amidase
MKKTLFLILSILIIAGCQSMHKESTPERNALSLRPQIIPRSSWDEGLPSGTFRNHKPERIVITDEGIIALEITRPRKYLNYINKEGKKDRKWDDIPYHFYIDRAGKIYQGRMLQVEAKISTISQSLKGDIYISFLDYFETREVTKQELESLVQLCAWVCAEMEIEPETGIYTDMQLGRARRPGTAMREIINQGYVATEVRRLWPKVAPEPRF